MFIGTVVLIYCVVEILCLVISLRRLVNEVVVECDGD